MQKSNKRSSKVIITLPRESLKYLDSKVVQVEIDEKTLNKELGLKSIKKAKGLLKKYNVDGLEYQKHIRKEWERDIAV
jgi:hypothetical protein